MKFKEGMKNLVLTALVISSAVLTWNIWFSEELWPNGYNSFPYEENFITNITRKISSYFQKGKENTVFNYNQLFYPKQIRVSKNGEKDLVLPNTELFTSMNAQIEEVLKIFLSDCTASEINEEELKKAYRATSVYIDYYEDIPLPMLGDFFNKSIPSALNPIKSFKHLLISLNSNAQEITLYLTDTETNKNYQVTAKADISELSRKASTVTTNSNGNYPFSFESNFDKAASAPGTNETRLPIDPYTVIYLEPVYVKSIENEKLLNTKDSQTASILNKLIEQFSINIGSSRRFTDTSGALNYVENYASLKISQDGLLEYAATSSDKGIKLERGTGGEYELVKSVGDFVTRINNAVPNNSNTLVFHQVTEMGKDKMKYTFNYLVDGIPVLINKTDLSGEPMGNSVEVVVEKNFITSYRQLFINYKATDQMTMAAANTIDVMDNFYDIYKGESDDISIRDYYIIYQFNAADNTTAVKWVFSLSDGEHIVVDSSKPQFLPTQ